MYWVYCSQAAVCTPYQHQHSDHDPHLWQSFKCHQYGTLGTCGGVPKSQEVSPELGRGLGKEYSPIGEN